MTKEITIPAEFPKVEYLSDEIIYKILPKADEIIDWLKAIQAHALEKALQGEAVPEHKLVYGRAYRRWAVAEEEVAPLLKEMEVDPFALKLRSVAQVEKEVGKKKFKELSELVEKPAGKLKLVHESAKGEPVLIEDKARESASLAFADDIEL